MIEEPTTDITEDDDIAKQILHDISKLDLKIKSGSSIRDKITAKLSLVVDEMEINPNEKASAIEAKMSIINTLLKTVNDEESQRIQAIRTKQAVKKDKDTEEALSSIGNIVTEYLKNIKPIVERSGGSSIEKQDAIIEEQIASESFEILDGELEIGNKTLKEEE